ncbi:MAG: hypothetical protein K8S15_09975, partial [Candidatus Aegiribacteria sp.]|nr:hypothetical protein [Candidatus Aegiribacteria sp.]
MLSNIISMIVLIIPPAITSESSWTSPDIRIATEWSFNVMDLVDPVYGQLGTVYGVESEDGFEWHTVLVDKKCVFLLEDDTVVNSIPYSGDIYRLTFSQNCQYLLGYCYFDEKFILFDLAESTVKSIPLFSSEMELPGNPLIRVTNNGTVLVKYSTYLRMYDSDFNCILSRDNFSWGHAFVGFSNAGDRFYTTTYDSLRAYDMQGNLLWNRELFEPDDQRIIHVRNLMLSHDDTFITVLDLYKLQIISTDDGTQIARFDFDESINDPLISESDSIIVLSCYFRGENIGTRSISLIDSNFKLDKYLIINDSRAASEMPVQFTSESVSDNGHVMAILSYQHPRLFARFVLLSPYMDIIWLSNTLHDSHAGFVNSDSGFR